MKTMISLLCVTLRELYFRRFIVAHVFRFRSSFHVTSTCRVCMCVYVCVCVCMCVHVCVCVLANRGLLCLMWNSPGPRFPITMDPSSYDHSYDGSFDASLNSFEHFPKLLLTWTPVRCSYDVVGLYLRWHGAGRFTWGVSTDTVLVGLPEVCPLTRCW